MSSTITPIRELPLSTVSLSAIEETGATSQALGLVPTRFQQRSSNHAIPAWSVRYVHPPYRGPRVIMLARRSERPSDGHPWTPRRPAA